MKISPALTKKLKRIKLIVSDVDGVLTEDKINLPGMGEEIKIFNAKDALRIEAAQRSGLKIIWITGRKAKATIRRSKELNVPLSFKQDVAKLDTPFLDVLKKKYRVGPKEILYIGDDWGDLFLMKQVGVSATPKNGSPENKAIADIISSRNGGDGVIAEVIEMVMRANGTWEKYIREYIAKYIY